MDHRLTVPLIVLLSIMAGSACAMLRQKRPLTWHLTLQINAPASERGAMMKQTMAVIERRLGALRVSNFEVKPEGDPATGRILVNLPELRDRDRVANLIRSEGKLELTAVVSPPNPAPVQTYATKEEAVASLNSGGAIPSNRRVLSYPERTGEPGTPEPRKWVVVEATAIVTGSELNDASATPGRGGDDEYEIQFELNKTGADRFGAWTGSHINEYLGVVFNDEVKSIAYIKSQIFDQGEITGRFTKQAAEDLALILKSGALPAPIEFVSESTDK